jgi:hypothetical protein
VAFKVRATDDFVVVSLDTSRSSSPEAVILSVLFRPAEPDESKRRTCPSELGSVGALHPTTSGVRIQREGTKSGAAIARECMGPSSGALRAAKGSASSG